MLGMENWYGTELTKSAKNEILAGFESLIWIPDHDPWVFLQVDKSPLYVAIYFHKLFSRTVKPHLTTNPIDPRQKWLLLNYSFVRIQNSLTNLVRDNKFFTIFVSKTRLVRLI